ncbi:MAG: DUF996 domain-containing protein [Candidatus Bathyarchaeota archaeon]|nr:DUF996 domain-containing protein [Candidatus Bathyarchaeota archaeon]
MSLESNRTLGGIGAILLAIPFLNLIGIILVLIALKGMADYYNDEEIFKNALYGFIFGIVGSVALVAFILMLVFGFATISPVIAPLSGLGLVIITVIVLYVFSLIAAIFYKKSLDSLSEKSGEHMFNTAGLILLIGAAIPVIGEILRLIAWILAAIGFFSIKMTTQPPASAPTVAPTPAPIPAVSTSVEKRFCQYCGAPIQSDAAFCPKCGKKID